jgi:hypothetical protein
MRDVGNDLILRMYLKGVCENALSDWLGISKQELRSLLERSGELLERKSALVEIVGKSSLQLSEEIHRCKYCGKPGKTYHIHHGYRSLCIGCLADKLNYGDKRHERYAWTNMTSKEIYAAFVDSNSSPTLCVGELK